MKKYFIAAVGLFFLMYFLIEARDAVRQSFVQHTSSHYVLVRTK